MDFDPQLDIENLSSAFKLVEGDVKVVNTLDGCVTFLTSGDEELTLRMTKQTQLFRDGAPCTPGEFAASIASKASIFFDPKEAILQALCFQTSSAERPAEVPQVVGPKQGPLANVLPFAPRNRRLAASSPSAWGEQHVPKTSSG
jgi:hypothetical protein